MKTTILILLLLLSPLTQAEETMYVSDQLRITLRTGQGNEHRILKTLASGEKVEVLETTETGYSHVRASDGTEGWVRTQYLMAEPIARDQLAAAQARLAKVEESLAGLRAQLSALKKDKAVLEAAKRELEKELATLKKRLAHLNEVAERPIALDNENRQLRETNLALEQDLELKIQENQILKDKSDREWFVIGAAVLIVGIVLGLVLPRLRVRRRSGW
ncbi:MAG TPA: TIGR04211 family SH3 domain-containing protein [Gammaproteobacteria bacterium]|nr:TIGR04211 family SH3 domain-containing protein [Gammaproteobacteria bacterium]